MRTLEREFTRELGVSMAVVAWNYFDTEHLTVAHSGYTDAKVLYEKFPVLVILQSYRLPVLGFLTSHSMSTAVIEEQSPSVLRFRQYNLGFLAVPSVNTFDIRALGPERTRISVRYKFYLRGWRAVLRPFMSLLVARWNQRVWDEDLPLRLRRQKVLGLGFKDFVGLPDRVADRRGDGPRAYEFPVPRPAEAPQNEFLPRAARSSWEN